MTPFCGFTVVSQNGWGFSRLYSVAFTVTTLRKITGFVMNLDVTSQALLQFK